MAMNLPGHLSYDSVVQLLEGRIGLYHGWHPAVMSWLLGLGDAVWRGTSLFVLLDASLLFGAMLSLIWAVPKVSWFALPVALGCVLLPQFQLYQAIVWKDVLFANAAVAGFIALAHAAARWPVPRLRTILLAISWGFLSLSALSRQNGVILLPFAAFAMAWIARRHGASIVHAFTSAGGTLVLSCAAIAVVSLALSARTVGYSAPSRQMRLLEFYDLNGALAADPKLALPELQRSQPKLLGLMRHDGRRLYSPARSDYLALWMLRTPLAGTSSVSLHNAWGQFIAANPGLYVRDRAQIFRWLLFPRDIRACVPYVIGVDGPSFAMRVLGLRARYSEHDEWMDDYAGMFVGTPVFSHVPFLLIGGAALAFLLIRRRDADLAFASMLCSVALFTLSFFVISIACDYRYLYVVDVSALIAIFYIALDPRLEHRVA